MKLFDFMLKTILTVCLPLALVTCEDNKKEETDNIDFSGPQAEIISSGISLDENNTSTDVSFTSTLLEKE